MQRQTIEQLEAATKAASQPQQQVVRSRKGGGSGKLVWFLVVGVLCIGGVVAGVLFVKPQSALSDLWYDAVSDATTALTDEDQEPAAHQTSSSGKEDHARSAQVERLETQLASMYDDLNNAQRELAIVKAERDEALAQAHLMNQVVRPSAAHRQTSSGPAYESMARDMSIRRAYGPLIRPGKYAFGTESKHPSSRPASYSALRDQGVTQEYNRFVNAMTGRGYYRDNDRRPFYQIPKTPQEIKLMKKLFEEFGDLAPIWVQMGVLQP